MSPGANMGREGAWDFLKGLEGYLDSSIGHPQVRLSVQASKGSNYESDFINAFVLRRVSDYLQKNLTEAKQVSGGGSAETAKVLDESKQKAENAGPTDTTQPLAPAHGTLNTGTPENLGTVSFASDPSGAEVYVDDSLVGKAPVTLSLKLGQHYVRMFATNYKNWSQQIMVVRGSELKLTAKLEKPN